jgi:hypothetical protein
MKTLNKICSGIMLVCWGALCIMTATGAMTPDPIDYCLATGLLALEGFAGLFKEE